MALCARTLVASEFLPVSLLTPPARDLGISEGQAGQAVSLSGLFAGATSLMITRLPGDRRRAVLGFTLLMIVSGAIVTLAPNDPVLMLACFGAAVGGFWPLSTALVMRLMPGTVPRGLAMLNAGVGDALRPSAAREGLARDAGDLPPLLRPVRGLHLSAAAALG